jgi:hypothetical protein
MDPEVVITHFEQSLIKCLKISFNHTKIKGCTFNFGQAIVRRINSLGLSK